MFKCCLVAVCGVLFAVYVSFWWLVFVVCCMLFVCRLLSVVCCVLRVCRVLCVVCW